jgi:hypothetical protein
VIEVPVTEIPHRLSKQKMAQPVRLFQFLVAGHLEVQVRFPTVLKSKPILHSSQGMTSR